MDSKMRGVCLARRANGRHPEADDIPAEYLRELQQPGEHFLVRACPEQHW